jgi:colanic acid biosynthesis protein WcaH
MLRTPREAPRLLPAEEYQKVVTSLPILCVDLVLSDRGGKYLLVRRKNEPLKGEWWVIGGRVHIGETVEAAARRKAREELGVELHRLERLGIYEDFFERNSFGADALYHTLSVVFGGVIDDLGSIHLDAQHDAWTLADTLPPRLSIVPLGGARTNPSGEGRAAPDPSPPRESE